MSPTDQPRTTVACRVAHFPTVGSTNTMALHLLRQGQFHPGDAITTDHQTNGRGTRGRVWIDEPGQSVMTSFAIRPDNRSAGQLAIPPAVAIVRWLRDRFDIEATTRWPNDVSIGDKKLAGVLIETCTHPVSDEPLAVIGVGINLNQTHFPADLGETATSVHLQTGRTSEIALEREAFLSALDKVFSEPFAAVREAWINASSDVGSTVGVQSRNRPLRGTVSGIDTDGALLVRLHGETSESIRVVSSADLERMPAE